MTVNPILRAATAMFVLAGVCQSAFAQGNSSAAATSPQLLAEVNQKYAARSFVDAAFLGARVFEVDPNLQDVNSILIYLTNASCYLHLGQQEAKGVNPRDAVLYYRACAFYNRVAAEGLLYIRNGNKDGQGRTWPAIVTHLRTEYGHQQEVDQRPK